MKKDKSGQDTITLRGKYENSKSNSTNFNVRCCGIILCNHGTLL